MGRLDNKVAVITGASSGVGKSCMHLFAKEGATVIGVARSQDKLDSIVTEISATGGNADLFVADVSDYDKVCECVQYIIEHHGQIDTLVNCAGVGWSWGEISPGSMNPVDTTPPEKWREVIGINLDSCFYMSKEVIPHMKKQGGGTIVNVSSMAGLTGLPDAHAYTAAKAGMINLTRSMCITYAQDNIRTNCVAPGYINTPMIEKALSVFDDPEVAATLTPMARPAEAEEIAYSCLFYAGPESSYCNGSTLVVDGGSTAT